MKLSYNWLKEYVSLKVSAEELAKGLTMSGSEVGEVVISGTDRIMDLEITSNRPDCLNIIGLAREASAVFNKDLLLPEMKIPKSFIEKGGPEVKCEIKNKKLCPLYTARIISNVKVKEVNEKIKKYLLSLGLRPVNNAVDVTNFSLMELGQPLHAFDLDKIRGGKIIVREALEGEKIITIDEIERTLKAGMLVIADCERPIAIAGVMGGKDTEVTKATKNILLESAYFDPVSVRQTARSLGLSSDSSYRFERGVDKGMIKSASNRASVLIKEETGGKIGSLIEAGSLSAGKIEIKFNIEKAERILGTSLKKEKVLQVFKRLGMEIKKEKDGIIRLAVPSFREDLKKEIDLVEEVARIVGYDKVPALVTSFVPQVERKEHSRKVIEKLYESLPAAGLNEIMTYSLINESAAERFSGITKDPVSLKNPLSEDQKMLTPQLLDGMLKAISWNINRKNKDLGLFEIGKIYSRPEGSKFIEIPALCMSLTGSLRKNWQEGASPATLYDLKGTLEAVLERLKIRPMLHEAPIKGLINASEVKLTSKGEAIGFLGEVNKKILKDYDIEQAVYICQIKLDKVMEKAILQNHYHAIARFPSSSRDISILCDQSLAAGEIHKVISETGEEIIRAIELVDVYQGEQVPSGKKSLSYSISYGIDTRTLKDEEIESVHSKIKEALTKKLNVTFR